MARGHSNQAGGQPPKKKGNRVSPDTLAAEADKRQITHIRAETRLSFVNGWRLENPSKGDTFEAHGVKYEVVQGCGPTDKTFLAERIS